MKKKLKVGESQIGIAYLKTEYRRLDELKEFQGNLKELYKDSAERLWKQMVETDFSDPFKVWEDPEGNINILDGHQRRRVLETKRKEGARVPDSFPCDFIRCRDRAEAKMRVLQYNSQYGKVTDEGLYEFIIENELDPKILETDFDIPNLNVGEFMAGYFEKMEINDSDNQTGKKETDVVKMVQCPKCGLKFNAK